MSFNAGTIEGNKVHGSFHDTNHNEQTYAATRTPNLTGTWSAVYHCEVGCPGQEFPVTDTLSQAEGSNKLTGTNEVESISGTLTGDTLELHTSTGGYEANATLAVSADGRSWSGPLQDSHKTSGTYTATKQAVGTRLGEINEDSYCASLGYPGLPGGAAVDAHERSRRAGIRLQQLGVRTRRRSARADRHRRGPTQHEQRLCVRLSRRRPVACSAGKPQQRPQLELLRRRARYRSTGCEWRWGWWCRWRWRWWRRLVGDGLTGGGAGAGSGAHRQRGTGLRDRAGAAAGDDDIRAAVLVASDPVWHADQRDPRPCECDDRLAARRHPDGRILRR